MAKSKRRNHNSHTGGYDRRKPGLKRLGQQQIGRSAAAQAAKSRAALAHAREIVSNPLEVAPIKYQGATISFLALTEGQQFVAALGMVGVKPIELLHGLPRQFAEAYTQEA